MKLRQKTLLVSSLILFFLLTAVYLFSSEILLMGFDRVEKDTAMENVHRVQEAFQSVVENLKVKAADWAIWDDTYHFVEDSNQAYKDSNLGDVSFSNLKIDYMIYLNSKEEIVFKKAFEYSEQKAKEFPPELLKEFSPGSKLLKHKDENSTYSGIIPTSDGPIIFTSRPILTSQRKGPIHGTLVFARDFDAGEVEDLSRVTKFPINFYSLNNTPIGSLNLAAERAISPTHPIYLEKESDHEIAGYSLLEDIHGKPAILSRVLMDRGIYQQANETKNILLGLFIVLGIFSVLIAVLAFDKFFFGALIDVTRQVLLIGDNTDLSKRIYTRGKDEISEMVNSINRVLEKIENSTHELELAKKQAEIATRTKSQFLANMSHEIRTPMNAVLGFVELLETTPINDTQQDYLNTIKESGNLLLTIIDDILDISKIEAGAVTLEEIDFDMEYLMEGMIRTMRTRMKGSSIELVYSYLSPERFFKGDPTRIRQIILNLLSNAIKFTKQGEIHLKVSSEKEGFLQIQVSDTGIGVNAESLKNLFKPFSQADASTTRRYGGTGLGLTIIKKFAEMMGGSVSVNSEEGKGSQFTVFLKLKSAPPIVSKKISPLDTRGLTDKSVVIVDDNKNSRQMLSSFCKMAGMKVLNEFEDSKTCLHWFAECLIPPDLLLCDYMMPEMDGFDLCHKLRRNERLKNLKMILVTSDAQPGSTQQAQKAGFDAFLSKPILRGELINVMRTVLGDTRDIKSQIITRHLSEEMALKGLRVLVAEDNLINQKLVKNILLNFGCEVELCGDGQQAVEKIKNNSYDICLMDIQMPVMGGYEAAQRVRQDLKSDIPMIALTAGAMQDDESKAFSHGMSAYLTKPIHAMILKETLLKWSGRG